MNADLVQWLDNQGLHGASSLVASMCVPVASLAQLAEMGVVPVDVLMAAGHDIDRTLVASANATWLSLRQATATRQVTLESGNTPARVSDTCLPSPKAAARAVPASRRVSVEDFFAPQNPAGETKRATIVVDSRERNQQDMHSGITSEITARTMPVGDYAVLGQDGHLRGCIIERKTDSDLASSVVDSRYRLQKAAMRRCAMWFGPGSRLLYLSEAEPRALDRVAAKRVQSALASTSFRDHMAVIRSQTPHQSGLWIDAIATTAQHLIPRGPTFDAWCQDMKNEIHSRSSKTLLGRILRVVRGSSHDFVVKIASQLRTVVDVFDFIEAQQSKDGDIVADFALLKLSGKSGMLCENASLSLRQILCSRNYNVP
uniref:Crossover junction endonuclease MUS81 n=1 Tax=Neobodo designis TaxID=312471 RepID=A0A7S1PXW0_NEODS